MRHTYCMSRRGSCWQYCIAVTCRLNKRAMSEHAARTLIIDHASVHEDCKPMGRSWYSGLAV